MSAIPDMSIEEIRALKVRMDFVSACIALEDSGAATDTLRERAIAEALAMEAQSRSWRSGIDRERAAETIRALKLQRSTRISPSA